MLIEVSYIELIFLHSSCIIDKLYKCKRKEILIHIYLLV